MTQAAISPTQPLASELVLTGDIRPPAALGIFDSGIGGLSVARELWRQHPHLSFRYLADQRHAPYGTRPLEEIRFLCEAITRFLLTFHVRVVVVACNSASAAALYALRERFPETAFVGMEPALKPAAEQTLTGRIGIVATAATFSGQPYAGVVARYGRNVQILPLVCPEFVPLVEAGNIDSLEAETVVARRLQPLLEAGVDQVVLGCTHYAFLRPVIARVLGPGITIVDPAPAVARQAARVAEETAGDAVTHGDGNRVFMTTGSREPFERVLSELLGAPASCLTPRWREDVKKT